jgi:uncharacterized hydrophobic protein (TIGR00271 family)
MKILTYIKQFIHFFNLSHELEKQETIHNEIQKGVIFKGTNLWILVFAILVASIGLNMNSTAVIIGAMLISPLMGPITGMGYSIAIYDGTLFSKSLKNFSFAVITSILTSTLYFTISPIATAHSELLARTSPTIYDVLIALFGGGAGIVALSSKQKGNVLPGVAIATALMPPLCTAGYGLATAQLHFFFGAFYLFLINTIFIALAATWVSKLFKFPINSVVDVKKKTMINRWLTFIISLILIPSIYFGFQLVKEERFKLNAEKFIDNVSFYEGSFLLKNEIKADQKRIKLVYAGNELSAQQKQQITQKLNDFDLKGDLIIEQGFSLNADDSQNKEIYRLKEQLNNMNVLLRQKQQQLDSLQQNIMIGQSLVNEISVFFPDVKSCIIAHSKRYKPNYTESEPQTIVIFELKSEITVSDKEKIKKWLLERMKTDQIELIFK